MGAAEFKCCCKEPTGCGDAPPAKYPGAKCYISTTYNSIDSEDPQWCNEAGHCSMVRIICLLIISAKHFPQYLQSFDAIGNVVDRGCTSDNNEHTKCASTSPPSVGDVSTCWCEQMECNKQHVCYKCSNATECDQSNSDVPRTFCTGADQRCFMVTVLSLPIV